MGCCIRQSAAKEDLRRGDIIIAVEGEKIQIAEQLQKAVEKSQIGKFLSIVVQRG